MSCRALVLYLKADWAELSTTLGFPSWMDSLRPCPCCNSSQEKLFEMTGLSPIQSPWRENREDDYRNACARCERHVAVNEEQLQSIITNSRFDKRRNAGQGRVLTADLPDLGLKAGDRITEEGGLGDVANLEHQSSFPCRLVLWRPSLEGMTRHRNPLFCYEIFLTPSRVITVDALHCVHLGVMLAFCKEVLWAMLEHGIWGRHQGMTEQVENGVIAARHELEDFYRAWDANTTKKLTRVSRFGLKHIGKADDRQLKTKGAQTWGILLFLVQVLQRRGSAVVPHGDHYLRAGQALVGMVQTWQNSGPIMSNEDIQKTFDHWAAFVASTTDLGIAMIPKRHLTCHLLLSQCRLGNPLRFANWRDESLNKVLKQACRNTSQRTFEIGVLLRMRQKLAQGGVKRRLHHQ